MGSGAESKPLAREVDVNISGVPVSAVSNPFSLADKLQKTDKNYRATSSTSTHPKEQ